MNENDFKNLAIAIHHLKEVGSTDDKCRLAASSLSDYFVRSFYSKITNEEGGIENIDDRSGEWIKCKRREPSGMYFNN